MHLNALAQLIVDRLNHFQAALFRQRSPQQRLKGLFLFKGRLGRLYTKQRLCKALVVVLGAFGIIKRIVDIGCPVIKCREQEARFRCTCYLSNSSIVEFLGLGIITQLSLCLLYRTDSTENVCVGLIGIIRLEGIIFALKGHIIAVATQQDQKTIIKMDILDNLPVERKTVLLVLNILPQIHQQLMFGRARNLGSLKGNIQQVFTYRTG